MTNHQKEQTHRPKYPIDMKDTQEREFKKTFYIVDKAKRLKRIREVIAMHKSHVKVNAGTDYEHQKALIEAIRDPTKKKEIERMQDQGLFYGWYHQATKRRLEIEIYIEEIIKEAEKLPTDKEKIDFLIDRQFDFHNSVFDNELENIAFKEEAESFIVDHLQEEINRIAGKGYEPPQSMLKPLEWTLNPNILGTIFGCLIDKGLISGTKTDLVRFLVSAFPKLNESTLNDVIKFKAGAYQKEVKELTEKYIEALPKKGKRQPKQKEKTPQQ